MEMIIIDDIERARANAAPVNCSGDEAELVAGARAGHAPAFDELFKRYERRTFTIAHRITRNHEDAEDIVQQSFLKAFVHLHKFEGKSSFSTWLTKIAINEALMLLRRGRRLREASIDDSTRTEEGAFALETPDSRPSPESNYSQRERERILCVAMNELTPGMRIAIELRELSELSTEETAGMMGLSVGAVKSRVFHGRRKLGERLKHHVGSVWESRKHRLRASHNTNGISRGRFACNVRG
jgi:RNA polymerase sigma-70 factor (ECF subfamily)